MSLRAWAKALQRRPWPLIAASLLLFALAGAAAMLVPTFLFGALLAAAAVVLLWLLAPEAVVIVLLLGRSSADGYMELFTLLAGTPLSMNLSGALNSVAAGLGLLTVLRRALRHQAPLPSAPGRAFALFLLVSLLSLPGSVDPGTGVKEWARLASGLAVYLMVADAVHDERRAERFVGVLLLSSLLPLAAAWIQRLTGQGYFFLGFIGTEFAYRPSGTFAHPAALGSYLVVLLTLVLCVHFSGAFRRLRPALLAWAAAAAGCLVLTLARAQWLGMMVAALVVGFRKRRGLALLALLLALVLLAGVPFLRERLTASESIGWRLDLWQAARTLAWPPTALGLGLGASPWHINQLLPKVDSPPHNDYIKVLIETGLLGLVGYALWLLAGLRHAWLAHRGAHESTVAWRALALLAVVVAGMVMGLVDNYLGYTAVQWYFWALLALVPRRGQWLPA